MENWYFNSRKLAGLSVWGARDSNYPREVLWFSISVSRKRLENCTGLDLTEEQVSYTERNLSILYFVFGEVLKNCFCEFIAGCGEFSSLQRHWAEVGVWW